MFTIRFGKHKGTPVNKLPVQYLAWLQEQPWVQDPLRSVVARVFEQRREWYKAQGRTRKFNALARRGVRHALAAGGGMDSKIKCEAVRVGDAWLVSTANNKIVDGFYRTKKLAGTSARTWTRNQEALKKRLETCRIEQGRITW